MNDVETLANRVTDSNGHWLPFGFLRPEPDERLSSVRVATLSVLQGLPVGILVVLVAGMAHRPLHAERLVGLLVCVCTAVFAVNRLTLAYFWNRRAERLARLRERREAWKEGR